MIKKKHVILITSLLILLTGCGQYMNQTIENADADEPLAQNETAVVTQEIKKEQPIVLYHANTMLNGFVTEDVVLDELSADDIIDELCSYNIVSTDTRVMNFSISDDKKTVFLDLNKKFGEYVNLVNEQGEYYILGSLVNSFLGAYDADSIELTINGETLETKRNTYTDALIWYEEMAK